MFFHLRIMAIAVGMFKAAVDGGVSLMTHQSGKSVYDGRKRRGILGAYHATSSTIVGYSFTVRDVFETGAGEGDWFLAGAAVLGGC